MKIAVDINGVLFSTIDKFIEYFNDRHGTRYTKKDVTQWEFYKDWNSSEQEFFELFYMAFDNIMDVPFIDEEASEYMKILNSTHDVQILSALDTQYTPHVVEKLIFHGIEEGTQYRKLIIIKEKPWDLKLAHEFDVYVDDNPHLVEPIKQMNDRYLLLYDQPWNQDSICKKNIFRVKNWKDVFDTINAL